jgi:hypothetical protein
MILTLDRWSLDLWHLLVEQETGNIYRREREEEERVTSDQTQRRKGRNRFLEFLATPSDFLFTTF